MYILRQNIKVRQDARKCTTINTCTRDTQMANSTI
jgi:hypothetical protein